MSRQAQTSFDVLEIWKSISHSWKLINKEAERALSSTGLSLGEVRILHSLHESGPVHITKLTGELLVTAGAITSLVDGLEAKGLVERGRRKEDRRVVTIGITSKGEATIKKAIALHKQYIARKFKALSSRQISLLVELLDRLSKS
jgi:MarR family 2-MHQ and catechol resistance regulon transcriptional repressor